MREHSEQLDQLAAALAAAQAEFSAIPKTATNPFFKSKYADLATVKATAGPVIAKHGLSVAQLIGFDGEHDTLTTWLLHSSGQFIAETMRLHLSKQDAQGQGSATTYARRYGYMAVLGLVADEDDDGNRASRPPARTQAPQPAPKPAGLPEATVGLLANAIKSVGVGQEWLRARLIALGVADVPEGKVTPTTLRSLSEDQAARLLDALEAEQSKAAA